MIDLFTDASYSYKNDLKHEFGIGMYLINYEEDVEYNTCGRYKFNDIKSLFLEKDIASLNSANSTLYEMFALVVYTQWLIDNVDVINENEEIRIFTDSLNVVELLYNGKLKKKSTKNRKRYDKFIGIVHNQFKKLKKSKNIDIDVYHIKSHCGVYGNVVADVAAKSALGLRLKLWERNILIA